MADPEVPQPFARVIALPDVRGDGIEALIQMLHRDSSGFHGLLAIAVVSGKDEDDRECVVYTTNLNYLEKLGLLEQAKSTLRGS